MEKIGVGEQSAASVFKGLGHAEGVRLAGYYEAVCIGPDGKEKWRDLAPNLVTTGGRNDLFDKYFDGAGYTAAWRMGLINAAGGATPAAGDTMASHAGWNECQNYSGANRPAITWNAAAGGNKATNGAVAFAITANALSVYGPFITTNVTVGGTGGILYSAGAFVGGNKSVDNGDTLNVTYTATST